MFIPKTAKKWLAVFRGDVAPSLIVLSTMLGVWFGLMPGLYGIHVALLIIALVLNVNVGIFLLFAGIGKSICFAAAPLLFHTGSWAQRDLDGILTWLTALPVLGLTDVSRYSVAGSLVLGPILGLVLGVLLAVSVQRFRNTWLRLESDSDAFNRWMSNKWVKLLARILVGKGSTNAGDALRKRAKYVRMSGVVLAVGVVGAAVIGVSLVSGDSVTKYVQRALTGANEAQVDIGRLDLEILKGRVAASHIAATDPGRPTHNRFEADELTANVSLWELLRGRLVLDEVVLSTVALEGKRTSPGRVVRPPEQQHVEDDEAEARLGDQDLDLADVAKLESYFKSADKLREHLRKFQEWLPEGTDSEAAAPTVTPPEGYLEYLDAVAPTSPTPRLVIRKLVIDNVTIPVDGLGNSRILGSNITDVPSGVGDPVVINVTSSDHDSSLKMTSNFDGTGGVTLIEASFADYDLAKLQELLNGDNPVVFESGRASATIQGNITRSAMDLALAVSIRGLKAHATGGVGALDPQITSEAMKVLREFDANMRLVGPTSSPRLVIDSDALGQTMRDALVQAGKGELARRAGALLGEELPEGVPSLQNGLPGLGDGLKLTDDDAPGKPGEETNTKDNEKDVKDQAKKALGGLFDKKKDGGDD